MQTVAVVDYGMGNLRSVVNALEKVATKQHKIILSPDAQKLRQADRIVFPGQGAARDCMRAIDEYGLRDLLLEMAAQRPFLGICMGMQVLLDHSEENGGTDCLAVYPGKAVYFGDSHKDTNGVKLKVPHMGWNRVSQKQQHPLWHSIEDGSRFYFVHSYHAAVDDAALIAGETSYGFDFTCAIARDNVFAMQCHPEKSATAGLQLLHNFLNWDGQV